MNIKRMNVFIIVVLVAIWGRVCFAEERGTETPTGTITVIVDSIVGYSPFCPKTEFLLIHLTNEMNDCEVLLAEELIQMLQKVDREIQKIKNRIEEIEMLKQRYNEVIIEIQKQERLCIEGKCEHWKKWRDKIAIKEGVKKQ